MASTRGAHGIVEPLHVPFANGARKVPIDTARFQRLAELSRDIRGESVEGFPTGLVDDASSRREKNRPGHGAQHALSIARGSEVSSGALTHVGSSLCIRAQGESDFYSSFFR